MNECTYLFMRKKFSDAPRYRPHYGGIFTFYASIYSKILKFFETGVSILPSAELCYATCVRIYKLYNCKYYSVIQQGGYTTHCDVCTCDSRTVPLHPKKKKNSNLCGLQ